MVNDLKYIDAEPDDAELLSSTAFNSKRFWGYPEELMNLWKDDLEITAQYIRDNKVVRIFKEDNFLGFYAIKIDGEKNAALDHLWLKPEHIKRNYGRQIFKSIIEDLSNEGFNKVTLVAEPNATGFYQKMKGEIVGKFQSKISGRFLDIYEFQIQPATNS